MMSWRMRGYNRSRHVHQLLFKAQHHLMTCVGLVVAGVVMGLGMGLLLHRVTRGGASPGVADEELVVSFQLCNGLTNQRLAFLNGLVISSLMDATMVLPDAILDGEETKRKEHSVRPQTSVSQLYDIDGVMKCVPNVKLLPDKSKLKNLRTKRVHIERTFAHEEYYRSLGQEARRQGYQYLELDCALFSIGHKTEVLSSAGRTFLECDNKLQASSQVDEAVEQIISRISSWGLPKGSADNTKDQRFNALHLRIEEEWFEHCAKWEVIDDGMERKNCLGSLKELDKTLAYFNISTDTPLYIATWLSHAELVMNAERFPGVRRLLEDFNVLTRHSLGSLGEDMDKKLAYREFAASVDYAVCARSQVFIGNRASTFSAHLLLSRFSKGQFAVSYNDDDIPLQDQWPKVPLFRSISDTVDAQQLRWIFTVLPSKEQEPMVRAAVNSAVSNTELLPTCIFAGSEKHSLVKWLRDKGVIVVFHELGWKFLFKVMRQGTNLHRSHLIGHPNRMHGTFLRVDVGGLGFTDRFALYTDTDVLFLRSVSIRHLTLAGELPRAFDCAPETRKDILFPCNAGVMAINLHKFRETHDALINMITGADDPTLFDDSPGDQGALNKFYKGQMRALPLELNWKPYWGSNKDAIIVHMHGPKCRDYDAYRQSKTLLNPIFRDLLEECEQHSGCLDFCDQFDRYANF